MSYFTGTATGTNDLLDIIKSNAITEGYTLNRDRVDGSPSTRELILTAVNGAVIGFKIYPVLNQYNEDNINIALNIGTSNDDLATFFNQPNSYKSVENDKIGAFCRDMPIKYHLSITSGRIFCAYFLENYLHTFYAGDFWAYDTPTNFPNPLFLSGNYEYDGSIDELGRGSFKNIIGDNNPKFVTGALDNLGDWIFLSGTNSWSSSNYKLCLNPFNDSVNSDVVFDKNGGYVFYPTTLTNNTTGYMLGELDGIYNVSGRGLKSGDIINDTVNDYIVFDKYIDDGDNSNTKFAFKLI